MDVQSPEYGVPPLRVRGDAQKVQGDQGHNSVAYLRHGLTNDLEMDTGKQEDRET
jgi:phage portal protein BeeE